MNILFKNILFKKRNLILCLLIGISVAVPAYGQGPCERLASEVSGPDAVFAPDTFVSYNLGIVTGFAAYPGTPPIDHKAQQIYVKDNHYGVAGYRWETVTDAYTTPGTPAYPGSPPNINSDDPRVIVTAQSRGNDFMNVTFQGPRNPVLAQILKISKAPAKDLKQFEEMFPISNGQGELPEAIELKMKIEQAAFLQAQQEAQKQADELKRRAEKIQAQEALEQQRIERLQEIQRQEKVRQENAARVLEEEKQLAIKEKNLSGFDDNVEISVQYDTSSFSVRGSGIGRAMVRKPTESKAIEYSIEKIKSDLNGITSEITYNFSTSFFLGRPTTKAYGIVLHLKGTRKEVVLLIARTAALFPPGLGFGSEREMLEKILAELDQTFPPKTPVRKWQSLVIQDANPYLFGERLSRPDPRSTHSRQSGGSPVWDGVPGPGSPVWGG